MKTQQHQLEALLPTEGWVLFQREQPSDWWLDQLWTLESSWSPVGLRAYLSFLVDPQASFDRPKGESVWAVAVTERRPARLPDAIPEVPICPHWERGRRDDVIAHLRRIRSAATRERAVEQLDAPDERRGSETDAARR
jgi:hypothetical protein